MRLPEQLRCCSIVATGIQEWSGPVAGSVARLVGCACLAAAVYKGPRFITDSARDLIGVFRGWRRDPETLWVGVAWVLASRAVQASFVIEWL